MNATKEIGKLETALRGHIEDLRNEIETLDREIMALETKRGACADCRHALIDILTKNGDSK